MKNTLRLALVLCISLTSPGLVHAQKKAASKPRAAAAPAEKGTLFFDKTYIDLGGVEDQENSIPVEFTFTNISKHPVKITDIKTSCNCTAADWPKEPVMHNEQKKVVVRFFPKGQSGQQEKTVTVYTDGQPGAYQLKLSVYVNDRFARLAKQFPSSQGNLRFDDYDLKLKPMFSYGTDSVTVQVYNPTDKVIRISGFRAPSHIQTLPSAMQVLPQGTITIMFRYYAARARDYGFRKDEVIMMTDDVLFPEKKYLISTTISEDFSMLTEKEKSNPPVFVALTPVVDLDSIGTKSVVTATFRIKNTGKTPMYIRKAWGSCGCTEVKYDSLTAIRRNKEAVITVTYNSTYELGPVMKKVYVITNTPQEPQHEMLLKANIVFGKTNKQN